MSNDSNKSMKLLNLETKKEFQIVRNTPSLDVRDQLRAISLRYQEENADRLAAFPETPAGGDQAAMIRFIRENVEQMKGIYRSNSLGETESDHRTIEMAKVIINVERLKDDERELVELSIDSPFWRKQDMEALGEWVDGFCQRNGIG